ncbi:unnamed protein product [Mucor fragilis]
MPITEYFQESNQIFYRMDDLRHPGNTIDIPAVDVLEEDPLLVELFEYKSRHTEGSSKDVTYTIPNHMEKQMIVDRLEVGHYATVLQLIQGTLTANKKPPYSLWLALFNFILTPVQSRTKEKHREHGAACPEAYKILLDVLKTHGAGSISPILNEFQSTNLIPSREYKLLLDDRYEMLDTKMLGKYSDFWEYTREVLSMK